MADDLDKKQSELKAIQDELKGAGLSRRHFLDRLAGVGVGFGAAFMLGIRDVNALPSPDVGVTVKSTNPAVDEVLKDGLIEADNAVDPDGAPFETAQIQLPYARLYSRGYGRVGYGRVYGRGYTRYARGYARGYGRGYGRVYRRF
jgi:hypothetical protein